MEPAGDSPAPPARSASRGDRERANRPIERVGEALARAASRSRTRAALVLLAWLVVAAVGVWRGSALRINADLKALLPQDAPTLVANRELAARRGHSESVMIAIEGPDPRVNRTLAADLARALAEIEGLREVEVERDYTVIRDWALWALSVEDLTALRDSLVRERQRAVARGVARSVGDGGGPDDVEELLVGEDWDTDWTDRPDDPPTRADGDPPGDPVAEDEPRDVRGWLAQTKVRLLEQGRLSAADIELMWPAEDQGGALIFPDRVGRALVSPDGTVIVIQAKASRPPTDVSNARALGIAIRERIAALDPASRAPGTRAALVGAYDVSRDVDTLVADMTRATVVAVIAVIAVLLVGFRRVRVLVIVTFPVLVSVTVTLGAAERIYGELNTLTAFLFAVLFGMGVDFAVHLIAQRECTQGEDPWPAVGRTAMRPLLAAMATTVVSLLVLVFAEFKAFREFGSLAAIGVAAAWIIAMTAVPALDTLLPGRLRVAQAPSTAAEARPTVRSPSSWSWFRWAVAGLALVCAGAGLPRLELERRLEAIRPPKGAPTIPYGRALGGDRDAVPVVLVAQSGADLDAAVDRLAALAPAADASDEARAQGWVKSVVTAKTALPVVDARAAPLVREVHSLAADFLAELADLPPDDTAQQYRSHLLALERMASTSQPAVEGLPGWARDAFTERDGRSDRLAHVSLRYDRSDLDAVRENFDRLDEVLAGVEVRAVSSSRIYADLIRALQRDLRVLPALTILAIVVMIALDTRSLLGTLATSGTLLLGLGAGLGALGLAGVHVNFYNMAVIPGVVGLGIDASIHLYHAGRQHDPTRARAANKGAWLSALTTAAAFAGLLAAAHPGLASIGVVGVGATLACVAVASALLRSEGPSSVR